MSQGKDSATSRRGSAIALRETFFLALDSLRAHKLRTFLTLLGVVLAVTTLVSVMSIVDGLNLYVANKIAYLGANAFVVDRFGIITNFEDWERAQKRPLLTVDDMDFLSSHLQYAVQIAGEEDKDADIRYGSAIAEDVQVAGVTPNFLDVRDLEVASGRFFTEADQNHRSPVCFIGNDIVEKLFPGVDPIGKQLRAGSEQYEVVGVAKSRGSVFGQSQDNFVMIPLGTFYNSWHTPQDSVTFLIEALSPDVMEQSQDEARFMLRARRHVPYGAPDNFGIVAPSSITGLWERITGNIFAVAIALTSVFFVVGGIVIMNIMLAAVTERTREIGMRKSLGARRQHIIMQVLVESSVLAASGGLIGVAAAYAIGWLVRTTTPIPITTPMSAVIIALILSTGVGLFFGIFPAMRAARLDPIEAMRAEA
jgi:putative ABC transport system permease protein